MRKNLSAEERLLALIRRKPGKENPAPAPDKPASSGRRPFSFPIPKISLSDAASLLLLNRILAFLAIALALYLFVEVIFIRPSTDISLRRIEAAAKPASGSLSGGAIPVTSDFSKYSARISDKKLFGAQQGPDADGMAGKIATSEDLSQSVGLVGIIPGAEPQAIIEDKKDGKTYYLKKGESFNNFVVEDISDGRVMLDYNGRKLSLVL